MNKSTTKLFTLLSLYIYVLAFVMTPNPVYSKNWNKGKFSDHRKAWQSKKMHRCYHLCTEKPVLPAGYKKFLHGWTWLKPEPVKNLDSEQTKNTIELFWAANTEPYVSGYAVSRIPSFSLQDPRYLGCKFVPVRQFIGPGQSKSIIVWVPKKAAQQLFNKGAELLMVKPQSENPAFMELEIEEDAQYTYSVTALSWLWRESDARSVTLTAGTQTEIIAGGSEGTVTFDEMTVTIGSNALPEGTTATVSIEEADEPLLTDSFVQASIIYDIDSGSTVFLTPVTVSVGYDASLLPGGMTEDDIRVFIRDDGASPWKVVKTAWIDKNENIIYAEVAHFSQITAGFLSGPGESQTRFNVNTAPPEFEIPNPLAGRMGIEGPTPNNFGILNQAIPIVIPQGKDGLTPNISLTYSSSRKNGIIGHGWALSKSAITVSAGGSFPRLDGTDKYEFNGNELVCVDSTVYPKLFRQKTESEYALFKQYDNPVDNYWEIVREGVIQRFGGNENSRVIGKGITENEERIATWKWQLERIEKYGQSIEYNYSDESGKSEPSSIEYLDGKLRVRFEYEHRIDVLKFSECGIDRNVNKRLNAIVIEEDFDCDENYQKIRTYYFTYKDGVQTLNGDSYLNQVSCRYQDTQELFAYQIEYYPFNYSFTSAQNEVTWNAGAAAIPYDADRRKMIDINGDGFVDIVCHLEGTTEEGNGFLAVFTNTGNGFSSRAFWKIFNQSGTPITVDLWRICMLDMNADGLEDAIIDYTGINSPTTLKTVYTNNGVNGFNESFSITSTYDSDRVGFSDMDGDGRPDLVIGLYGYNDSNPWPKWLVYTNEKIGFSSTEVVFNPQVAVEAERTSLIDMNGDGRIDFVVDNSGRSAGSDETDGTYSVYLNTGKGFLPNKKLYTGPNVDKFRKDLMDMNADGRPDLIVFKYGLPGGDGVWDIYYNNCEGFDQTPVAMTGSTQTIDRIRMLDINNDGRPDLLVGLAGIGSDNEYELWINKHTHFEKQAINLEIGNFETQRLARYDMDGDGLKDYAIQNDGRSGKVDGSFGILFRQPNFGSLLKKIHFNGASINYQYTRQNKGIGNAAILLAGFTLDNNIPSGALEHLSLNYTFTYENGKRDRSTGIAYGYETVTVSDANGNRTVTWYNQEDPHLIGRAVKSEKYVGQSSTLISRAETGYELIGMYGGLSTNFVVTDSLLTVWDLPHSESITTRETFSYYGLDSSAPNNTTAQKYFKLFRAVNYKEVNADGSGDVKPEDTTITEYEYTEDEHTILNILPKTTQTIKYFADNSEKISEQKFWYFDRTRPGNIGDWGRIGEAGLITKSHSWNGFTETGTDEYLETRYDYDPTHSYLFKEKTIFAGTEREAVETYFYDNTLRYTTRSTVVYSHNPAVVDQIQKSFDPIWGLLLWVEDNNGQRKHYRYDKYLRQIAEYRPKDIFSGGAQTDFDDCTQIVDSPVKKYVYGADVTTFDTPLHYTVTYQKKFYTSDNLTPGEEPYLRAIGFVDGLRRSLQTTVSSQYPTGGSTTEYYVVSGKTVYDDIGEVIEKHDPVGIPSSYSFNRYFVDYDLFYTTPLRPEWQVGPKVQYEYDDLNRIIRTTKGAGNDAIINETEYIGLYQTRYIDAYGNVKTEMRDEYGRTTNSTDFVQNSSGNGHLHYAHINYVYDRKGNLLSTTDISNNTILLTYDELSRKTNMTDPDMGRWTYQYNIFGNLNYQKDANGNEIEFEFDERGRTSKKTYITGTGVDVTYVYGTSIEENNKGRLVSVTDASGIKEYNYNIHGEVTEMTHHIDGTAYTTEYAHDALGRITRLVYPYTSAQNRFAVKYKYQPYSGLLNSIEGGVIDQDGNFTGTPEVYMSELDYDHFGRRSSMTYGNGVKTSYVYDALKGNLDNALTAKIGGTTYQNIDYNFDKAGNLIEKSDSAKGITFSYFYDDLYRLTKTECTMPTQEGDFSYANSFSYNELGNILEKDTRETPDTGNRDYIYHPTKPHAVVSYTGEYQSDMYAQYSFEYDNNGNTIQEKITSAALYGTITKSMMWNADNQMTAINVSDLINGKSVSHQYTYDATGERIKAIKNGVATLYIGGLSQYKIDAAETRQFFIFDGINRISSVKQINADNTDGYELSTFFLHTDHIGSTSLVTTVNGDIFQELEYRSFGEIYKQRMEGVWQNVGYNGLEEIGSFAFTGQEIDLDTGLYYYGARYYNPHSGRFISADSVIDGVKNSQGYNRYSYVQNNPITYNDPTGHWSVGLGVTIGYTKSGGWSVGVGASWDIGTGPSMNLGATYRVGHLDSARDIKDLKYDRSNLSLNTGATLYWNGFYAGWGLGYDFGSGQATTSTNAGYEIFGFGSGTTLTWGFDTRNDWNPSFTIGQDFFAGGQGGISVGPSVTWTKGEERTRQINFGAFGAHATYSPDAEEGNQWDYGFSTTTTVGYDSENGGMQKPSNSTIEAVDAANQHIEDMENGWDEKNWGPKPIKEGATGMVSPAQNNEMVLTLDISDNQVAYVDANGNNVTRELRTDFVAGQNEQGQDRARLPNGDYTIGEASTGDFGVGYGTFYIDTGDTRGRDIHGGGTRLGGNYADRSGAYAPNQGWRPTYGCGRMQNSAGEALVVDIQGYRQNNPNGTVRLHVQD